MIRSTFTAGIFAALLTIVVAGAPVAAADYDLTVNANTRQGDVPHFWSRCCGTGGAQLCVNPDWKRAAKMGVEEAGFMAYRGHRILWYSNPISWSGGNNISYNWTKFDEVYDFLVDSLGTIPVVELSSQPRDLQTSGEWSPPKDLNVYRQMIQAVVEHCNERYGQENVRKWYWEVWNEWDYEGFWSNGTEQQYYDMYKAAVEGATAADPEVRIGGPSTTGSYNNRVRNFLNYCKSNNVQVDLVSNHCYGGGGSGPNANPAAIRDDNRTRSDDIKSYGKPLVSMNTEYSSSYSGQGGNTGANIISMDSHINAPFVAKCVKLILDDHTAGTYQLPEVFSYWAISDVFDEHTDEGYIKVNNYIPFGGVFGLINYQGIPKATFNAFRMLHKMGTIRLPLSGGTGDNNGVDGFATVNDDTSEVAVMIYNFFGELDGHNGSDNVSLTVNNLPFPDGKVAVTHYRVDADHSNPYGVWLDQNKPRQPSAEMREASNLAVLAEDTIDFSGGAYTEDFSLAQQGLSLIILKRDPATSVGAADIKSNRPAFTLSGTKIVNNGKELVLSLFGMDGKLITTRSTTASTVDLKTMAGSHGVCLVRIQSGGNVVTTKYIRMR